jgi:hypothetical protein
MTTVYALSSFYAASLKPEFLCGLWGLVALCGVKFEDDNNNDYDDEHEHEHEHEYEHEHEHEHENTANKVGCCNSGFLIL